MLYAYGARPVLYSDDSFYKILKNSQSQGDRYRYLFSEYSSFGYNDWMHEREWRVRANTEVNDRIGLKSADTDMINHRKIITSCDRLIPLHLPEADSLRNLQPQLSEVPQFVLLVESEQDKIEMGEIFRGSSLRSKIFWRAGDYSSISNYRDKYIAALQKASLISFEYIREQRERLGLWRLEDLV